MSQQKLNTKEQILRSTPPPTTAKTCEVASPDSTTNHGVHGVKRELEDDLQLYNQQLHQQHKTSLINSM
jgi:hypothetical protein